MADVPPRRRIGLSESGYQMDAPLPVWDFYKAVTKQGLEYEATHNENTSKITIMENIKTAMTGEDIWNETIRSIELSLKNDGILPADMTLAEIFGTGFSSGQELQGYLSAWQFIIRKKELENEIADKQGKYNVALKSHQAMHEKLQREADEKIKQTLQIFKNSGFDLWGIDYFLAQIDGGFLIPDIGVPFDVWNIDLKNQNFGEPRSVTNSLDRFVENLYRFVNKGITGNAEGQDENWNLVWFSIEQAIRNPTVQQKTDGELKSFMKQFWVWDDLRGFDKVRAIDNLCKPTNSVTKLFSS